MHARRYADGLRVLDDDGAVLGEHTLTHDHDHDHAHTYDHAESNQ